MRQLQGNTVDLVVTSPPYPMIEMWDEAMSQQNPAIRACLPSQPEQAFELMHAELDKVWRECHRVVRPGGFLCINIGDATRTVNGAFRLYDNHGRISRACLAMGFTGLPNIIWRKQTNAPNKFMGSGMLPCGAYVTLEHEWILIFRKGERRVFKTEEAKQERGRSAFFWEERNVWFSDVWEVKGARQRLQANPSRERSAAFPFEIPYRLINMFSQKGDLVLDPFLGTGTTMQAAMLTTRNSCGYEIYPGLESLIRKGIGALDIDLCNGFIKQRVDAHKEFVRGRVAEGKEVKHYNKGMDVAVMTKQEEEMELNYIESISANPNTGIYEVTYETRSDMASAPALTGLFANVRESKEI